MNPAGRAFAVVVAAGKGSRMGASVSKVYLPLHGRPLLAHTLDVFEHCRAVDQVCLVVADGDRSRCQEVLGGGAFTKVTRLVSGGRTRQESVYNGVIILSDILRASDDVVAIHDGARPLLSPALLRKALDAASKFGAAVPVIPAKDTVKWVGADGFVKGTPDRAHLGLVQTPQVFRAGLLLGVLEWARRRGISATDEAALFEQRLVEVKAIPGDEENLKVTTPHDLFLAEAILAGRGKAGSGTAGAGKDGSAVRVGIGYDIHRLEAGRRLVLGGVELAHPDGLGLAGHSDADAAVHAVMDAFLGAAGLSDIGSLFPPDDPRYAGASSLSLLEMVVARLAERGLATANVDVTIVAEAPRIMPHVEAMKQNIAAACQLDPEAVGVKATTNEGLGPVGEGRGIAAYAVAVVRPQTPDRRGRARRR